MEVGDGGGGGLIDGLITTLFAAAVYFSNGDKWDTGVCGQRSQQ